VLVTDRYQTQSASAIAVDLIARYAAVNGFTSTAVVPNLPVLDEITFTNEPLDQALTRIARRIGGYWFVDYQKAVHLFLDDPDPTQAPEALTPTHHSLRAFQKSTDRTQVLTRVYVEGRGSTALATVGPGDTQVPLDAVDMFAVGPDVFVKVSHQGSAGGADHLTFTGVVPGGAGALVGSGTAPSSLPVLTATSGGAVAPGDHHYAYSWLSAVGETVASPVALLTISGTAPAGVAPGIAVADGAGLAAPGTYTYGVTHVTAAGETAVAGSVAAVCTNPNASTTAAPGVATAGQYTTNIGRAGEQVVVRIAYRNSSALSPATIGPQAAALTLRQASGQPAGVAEAVRVTIWALTDTGGALYADVQYKNQTTGSAWFTANTYNVPVAPAPAVQLTLAQVTTKPNAIDTGGFPHAAVTVTVNDGGADVTARRVYRTKVNGSQLYFLKQVTGTVVTSFVDTTADSSLVTPPAAGVAALQTVTVSGIATGPHSGSGGGTTARQLYRTTGGSWYRLATIADNTTTTYVDAVGDGGLGLGGGPVTDTSGLVADGGQVLAGAPTIPVSGTGAFPPTGGWVLSGNNRVRYAGVTAAALTGIPAAGDGAIANTIPYGTPITLAPMLTGVGGITAPIVAGDELYLVVQADDPARQTTVADMVHAGPGVREEWVQDRRLSITEARARAQATLALRPLEDITITYACRDTRTAAGKTITVNLPAPTNVWGTFKIQSVTINNFRPHPTQYPTYTVTASSRRFSFEDWLRRLETSV
jgi:hypothetical protein